MKAVQGIATRIMVTLFIFTLYAMARAEDYIYTTNNGAITITGYTCPSTNVAVIIPDTITALPVTGIGNSAFYNCTSLTSVWIPNSVTNIGSEAFRSCINLTNVTIPDGVTTIGGEAFRYCSSLTSITISKSVTNIGDNLFSFCTNLTAITVDASNFAYSSVDGILFNKSQTNLIQCPGGRTGSYTILNSVKVIGSHAFWSCTHLTNVVVPRSVTIVGQAAFRYNSSLASVIIGNNVTSIGNLTFESCINLTGVYFQGNAPPNNGSLFDNADKVKVYYLPGTSGWGETFSGRPTVLWKPQVTTSDGVFGVRTNQFGFTITWASDMLVVVEACTNLSNPIWAPLKTNAIIGGLSYFSDPQWNNFLSRLYRLRWLLPQTQDYNYTINDGQITVTKYTGPGGTVIIPDTINGLPVTIIGSSAFYGCSSLTNISIPQSVISIGFSAFSWCTRLTSILTM